MAFSRKFFDRVAILIMTKTTRRIFTEYIIWRYRLRQFNVKKMVFFDFPYATKIWPRSLDFCERKILYYWNPIISKERVDREKECFDEVWTCLNLIQCAMVCDVIDSFIKQERYSRSITERNRYLLLWICKS